MESKIQKQNIGNAGEYYIASILSANNFIVTITLGRAERYDILAVNPRNKTIKISVKTRLKKEKRFPVSQKEETGASDDFYYAFIRLNEFKETPDFWIIPSRIINKLIYEYHQKWLQMSGKNKRPHRDSGIRNLWIESSSVTKLYYPNDWDNQLKKYYKNIEQLKNA